MVFKSLNALTPQYLSDLFTGNLQVAPYYLRNTMTDVRLPRMKTMGGQKGFSYRGAKLWSSLPAEPTDPPVLHIRYHLPINNIDLSCFKRCIITNKK